MTDRVRRNGQLSSCEPCRRSKLRCDHGRPHCARCERRSLAQQCYYHPAPLAGRARKTKADSNKTPASAERPPDDMNISEAVGAFGASEIVPSTNASWRGSNATSPRGLNAPVLDGHDRGTSFASMHTSLLPGADVDHPNSAHGTYTSLTRTGVVAPPLAFQATPALIEEGADVIDVLLSFPPGFNDRMEGYYASLGGAQIGGPLVKAAWRATHSDMEAFQSLGDCSRTKMRIMSKDIFRQTCQPFNLPVSAADGALERTLSPLRWETVGLYFVLAGYFISLSKDFGSNQKAMMHKVFDACMQCEVFSGRIAQVNDLTIWLLAESVTLATWCYGDDSYHAWRLVGDVTSAVFALGFHRGFQNDKSTPLYILELRKRVMALSYEQDKTMASFVGRPPRLSKNYCTFDLPLDLPDDALTASLLDLEAAKARLDKDGWNQDNAIYPNTRYRAILLLSIVREEVLELSLGPPLPDLSARAEPVLSQLASTWDSIPQSFMKYDLSQWDTMPTSEVLMLYSLELEHLYIKFLLFKLLVNQMEGYRDDLIQTSHEILDVVLSAMKRRNVLINHRIDLEWTMVFYAMPCASVLILELFRQTRNPQPSVILNKSTIIQDISVLISSCDWLTESGQSNHEFCQRAKAIFSRSLDRVLDYQPGAYAPPETNVVTAGSGGTVAQPSETKDDLMDVGAGQLFPQDAEWNAWLENFDLSVEPWLEDWTNYGNGGPSG